MSKLRKGAIPQKFLGIEGGATHTVALMTDLQGRVLAQALAGPANIRLLNDGELRTLLNDLRRRLPHPDRLAIGLAGARTAQDRERIRAAAELLWPGVPCYATNDLETALMAEPSIRRTPTTTVSARVLILSGTGSCCYGRAEDGRTARTGGWGHLLGDRGSGYDLGVRALREALRHFDRTQQMSPLGQELLRRLQCSSPEEWIDWIQEAGKAGIAALASVLFKVYSRDPLAREIVRTAADDLARDAVACANQVASATSPVEFIMAGGVLLNQPVYARRVEWRIRLHYSKGHVRKLMRPSVWGAVALARSIQSPAALVAKPSVRAKGGRTRPASPAIPCPSLEALATSPTEQRNPRSMQLGELPVGEAIELMLKEDRVITTALLRERAKLERAIHWVARALKRGGRLFYVGAGTSGRLGVLDASECPPTFRTSPEMVQGIIAGGPSALWQSVEGAEDDAEAGAEALRLRSVTARDVVVGIAASGRTPFVWGALWYARRQRAKTVLLCFNPAISAPPGNRPALMIAPDVGPEVLTGSTRLKSGTATKLVLNLFTTLAMARLGKVVSNLMVDLNPSNVKLRGRAVRIVSQLTGDTPDEAQAALERADWVIAKAVGRSRAHPSQRPSPPHTRRPSSSEIPAQFLNPDPSHSQ